MTKSNRKSSNRKASASCSAPSQPGLAAITLDDIEDAIVAQSANDLYVANILHLILWLKNNAEQCLTSLCIDIVTHMIAASPPDATSNNFVNANKHSFANNLRGSRKNPLVHLKLLEPPLFMKFVLTLRKDGNTYLGQSLYNHKRSSLFHLFRLHNDVGYDAAYKARLAYLYKGFNRRIVQQHPSQQPSQPRVAKKSKKLLLQNCQTTTMMMTMMI